MGLEMGREREKVVGNTLERPISGSRNSSSPTKLRSELRRETGAIGGGHGGGNTYRGMTLHAPKRWHSVTGKGLCAIMWFWVFYRAKQDGPVVLGWRHPWEGHGDHSHEHGHEHEASH